MLKKNTYHILEPYFENLKTDRLLCTLVSHSGTPRVSSHLTLDFVVPCPLSLPSLQTKDIFGQTQAGCRSRISSVTHLCSLTNMYHGTPP